MVRWVCKSCSILVDTKAKEIRGQCYQGFACGEKGEATDEILKIGNLCCNCAKHAGMEQLCMIRSFTERWNNSDCASNDFACRHCERRGRTDDENDEMENNALANGDAKSAIGLTVKVRGNTCEVDNILSFSPAALCRRIELEDQVVAIDGFHVTPKNVFTLLKGDDTPGHLTSIKFRREKVFRAIEVVLTRVSAIDLAERRRHEAKLAIEKRLAEEAYEAVRVQQELYAAQLALAKKEIAVLVIEAEARFEKKAARDELMWQERQRLRSMREEVEEGSRQMAEAILEGTSKQLALASALNSTRLREYPLHMEALDIAYQTGHDAHHKGGGASKKAATQVLHIQQIISQTLVQLLAGSTSQ